MDGHEGLSTQKSYAKNPKKNPHKKKSTKKGKKLILFTKKKVKIKSKNIPNLEKFPNVEWSTPRKDTIIGAIGLQCVHETRSAPETE